MRPVPALALLTLGLLTLGCARTDTYGGGDGLTLTLAYEDDSTRSLDFPGASEEELQDSELQGRAYAKDDGEVWTAYATGEAPDAEFVGLSCGLVVSGLFLAVTEGQVSLRVSTYSSSFYLSGEGADGSDALDGFVETPVEDDLPEADCSEPYPAVTELSAEWSLDEGVRSSTRGRCVTCGVVSF